MNEKINYYDFIDELRKNGFKKIDSGSSAEIFVKGNTVYKVFEKYSTASERKFINYCIAHKANKNLQKVKEFKQLGKSAYIKTELYKKIPRADWNKSFLLGLRLYGEENNCTVEDFIPKNIKNNKDKFLSDFSKTNLYKTLEDIKLKKLGHDGKWMDLDYGNFMYDNSKNVVIIDI